MEPSKNIVLINLAKRLS